MKKLLSLLLALLMVFALSSTALAAVIPAAAVSAFFQVYGNAPNNVATASMQGELFTVYPRTYSGATLAPTQTQEPADQQTLSEGNIGSTVERIQQRLIDLGYMQGLSLIHI